MAITLYLPTVLAKLADRHEIEADGRTVGDAVADVIARYPALAPRLRDEAGDPYPFVTFYLNDEDIRFRGGVRGGRQRRRRAHRGPRDRGRLKPMPQTVTPPAAHRAAHAAPRALSARPGG